MKNKKLFSLALTSMLFCSQLVQAQTSSDLEHLKLTPQQIAARSAKLNPLLRNLSNLNTLQTITELKSIFGVDVFVRKTTDTYQNNGYYAYNRLVQDDCPKDHTVEDAMRNAVIYLFTQGCFLNTVASSENPLHGMKISPVMSIGEDFYNETTRNRNPYYENFKSSGFPEVAFMNISETGPEKEKGLLRSSASKSSWSVFDDRVSKGSYTSEGLLTSRTRSAAIVSSTLQRPVVQTPIAARLVEAFRQSGLKALDVTLVVTPNKFTADKYDVKSNSPRYTSDLRFHIEEFNKTYKATSSMVIYPAYSLTSPIPKPIMILGDTLTVSQIKKVIEEHAPKIYAYNKLVEELLLPTSEYITEAMNHPVITAEVAKMSRKLGREISQENLRQAIMEAYLSTVYVGLAAGAAVAVIANPSIILMAEAVFFSMPH